ncbi:hypothetical protein D9M68_963890 [compost metagenome]
MQGNVFNLRDELVEAPGFGDVEGDAQALELCALGRADTAGPEQEQVGLEAEQALHVQLAVTPYGRQVFKDWRTVTAIQHAHQEVGGAQFNDDFRQRRRKADDPRRRHRRGADGQQQDRQPAVHQPSWRGMRYR